MSTEKEGPSYQIRITRCDPDGRFERIEFDRYSILRELLNDLEAELEDRGWLEESEKAE